MIGIRVAGGDRMVRVVARVACRVGERDRGLRVVRVEDRRADPQRVDAHLIEVAIADLLRDAGEVTALPLAAPIGDTR